MTKLRPSGGRLLAFFLLFSFLIGHTYWALNNVAPIHDASNCVSRASNLGTDLYRGHFSDAISAWWAEKNNFLSLGYFGLGSLVFGPGRLAWGFGWAAAAALFFLGVYAMRRPHRMAVSGTLVFIVVFFCSPLVSRTGGLLDQRFDPIAVLLLLLSATALFYERLLPAVFLSALAIYAKGPAVPVAGLLWITALVTGVLTFRHLIHSFKNHRLLWILMAVLAAVYCKFFLKVVMSYNLMAVHPKTGGVLARILEQPFVYLAMMWRDHPLGVLLLVGALLSIVWSVYRRHVQRKAVWGLLFFLATYALFSAHPVKSDVLTIWFVPGIGMAVVGLFSVVPQQHAKRVELLCCILAVAGAAFGFYKSYLTDRYRSPTELGVYWDGLRSDSRELAKALARTNPQRVRLLVNFNWWPLYPKLAYNYDAFRVLIAEEMGRNAPVFEGWELGCWSRAWLPEINSLPARETRLVLLSVGGQNSVHHLGIAQDMAKEVGEYLNPACEIALTFDRDRPTFGAMRAFFTDETLKKCAIPTP